MQEPQYTNHTIRLLLVKIAEARLPCLSIIDGYAPTWKTYANHSQAGLVAAE
jgi:hypothetical protein